jgi:hypothetical protein
MKQKVLPMMAAVFVCANAPAQNNCIDAGKGGSIDEVRKQVGTWAAK